MDKRTIDAINYIVWIIPHKKLRNNIRHLLTKKFEIHDKLHNKLLDIEKLVEVGLNADAIDRSLVIKTIDGGLSDQITSYFIGRIIELKYNRKVKYDISPYGKNINGVRKSDRNFELLNLFPNLKLEIASNTEILIYKKLYNIEANTTQNINEYLSGENREKPAYFYRKTSSPTVDDLKQMENIFKSELDFDKYVYPLLEGQNLDYYNEIKSAEISVGIHARRDDYINYATIGNFSIPDPNYYINAIDFITKKLNVDKSKIKFFFFSDEMSWVKENIIKKLDDSYNYTMIEANNIARGYIDFYLLMSTMHRVGSMGGFCAKAHFFCKNPNKMFIGPESNSNINNPILFENFVFGSITR